MKLAIIINPDSLSGKLTKFFTGCYAYHTAWVDVDARLMYDMNLLRRRRWWPHYPRGHVVLFDAPAPVTREYLEEKLTSDKNRYGVLDYLMFALRPLYHLIGKSTRNADGEICSGMINADIWANGGTTPWRPGDAPPSPCDILNWMNERVRHD